MTPGDVRDEVNKIRALVGWDGQCSDPERAHSMADALHVRVLRAIADGDCIDYEAMAEAALDTEEIDCPRWCA